MQLLRKKKKNRKIFRLAQIFSYSSLPFLSPDFFFLSLFLQRRQIIKTAFPYLMKVPLPCRCFSLICYNKCALLFTFCFSSHLINSASHFFHVLCTWSSGKRLQLCKHKIPFLSPGNSLEETKKLSRIPPHPFSFGCFFPSSGQTDKQTKCRT